MAAIYKLAAQLTYAGATALNDGRLVHLDGAVSHFALPNIQAAGGSRPADGAPLAVERAGTASTRELRFIIGVCMAMRDRAIRSSVCCRP